MCSMHEMVFERFEYPVKSSEIGACTYVFVNLRQKMNNEHNQRTSRDYFLDHIELDIELFDFSELVAQSKRTHHIDHGNLLV